MAERMSRAQRNEQILASADDLVFELGLESLNMQLLAERAGVSRQTLYQHFTGTDDVLRELFDRSFQTMMAGLPPTSPDQDLTSRVLERTAYIFSMDDHLHRMLSSAFFATPHDHHAKFVVRAKLLKLLDDNWIVPLVERGISPDLAISTVTTVFGSILLYRTLINEGSLSMESAQRQIVRLIEILVAP